MIENNLKATVSNTEPIPINQIPVLSYANFYQEVCNLLKPEENHCVCYYAFPYQGKLKFICAIANDLSSKIDLISHELAADADHALISLTQRYLAMHIFEREIYENHGIEFKGHPWLKPVRYAFDRAEKEKYLQNYPFYKIDSPDLHEVGVGPIHAGVIEPGHFRFLCDGETVLHLEIQLGYQHRGIEHLFLHKKKLLQRTVLAESITSDSTIAHTLAFVQGLEALSQIEISQEMQILRALALELERIGIHVGDLSAMCTDIAYQLGAAVFGALRTPVINFFQLWCGNRFGKGLLRVGYNPYPFTEELQARLTKMLAEFEVKYVEMADECFALPSVQSRFERTGEVTQEQMLSIGAVGMSARITGLYRDVRYSHPFAYFKTLKYTPETTYTGDVWARGMLRHQEIIASIGYIRTLLELLGNMKQADSFNAVKNPNILPKKPAADTFIISLTEGWRGEICHAVATDEQGEILHYKVKDPSMHNWLALALAVRNNEISDFPICNKSFDLSYCGHDL